ncbi:hypothetical protein Ddye_020381 [Dipteronia dyeriana]|uniref:Bet v I/Major latex protein domain-containing protein n=1 Tax=Dipteronia dyeriana TaxID=168575 RepID=A0AAD9U0E7_9ROSI|nr:hypothetical protein Ddye_020381 [Dipteronia dyeriana]
MSALTFTEELIFPVAAGKLFKAVVFDSDNLFPKLIPEIYRRIEIIEGDGGPGSIKKAEFSEGAEFKYLKKRIDALDEEKLTYGYTVIEGDVLMDNVESIAYEVKFEATPDGEGCKCTYVSKYTLKPGAEISEKQLKDGKAKLAAMRKAMEVHLLEMHMLKIKGTLVAPPHPHLL